MERKSLLGVNEKELISVIVPAYNRAEMLTRAIKSVLAQDYINFEIIVVDDASTEDIKQAVESFKDERILYFRQQENRGAAAARNIGMRKARGEYLAFLDSDDEFVPNRLSRLLEVFRSLEQKPGMIFTNASEINTKREKVSTVDKDFRSGYVTTECKFPASVFTPTSCWIFRREACRGDFFDEEIQVGEDCDYFARIVRKQPSYFLNELLVVKHVHDNAQGRVPLQCLEQTKQRILKKWFPKMKKDKKFLVNFYCAMAKDLVRCGNKKKARDVLWKAFLLSPFNFRVFGKFMSALGR
ncbi:MAG: glycosyltransferase family 2 protein [Candidatus Omnitrophica bacterium]|nr:glycosyltransferase family 2 protein [Candidatus Omnitrophota bacterium]